jgi:hypothetical protein
MLMQASWVCSLCAHLRIIVGGTYRHIDTAIQTHKLNILKCWWRSGLPLSAKIAKHTRESDEHLPAAERETGAVRMEIVCVGSCSATALTCK